MLSFNKIHYVLALFLILALSSFSVMSRKLLELEIWERHEQWMNEHGKFYKDAAEKEKRFQIFKENVEFIESFNADGNKTFKVSINQFSDLTSEEFKASLNGQKGSSLGVMKLLQRETHFRYENVTEIPATMDWREKGAVTPIKNQHRCGSCWAFATVAATEGIHQISSGKLTSLSEQELVNCVKGKSEGCDGGYMEEAYEFIVKNGGIASESKYPYKGVDRACNANNKKQTHHQQVIAAQIKGYEKVPSNSEKSLLKAVTNQPVGVYIEGGQRAFQFYSNGVFSGKCGTDLDHAVTIVGYGSTEDGVNYWLVKNSWGTKWGEKGYVRMKRHIHSKKGLCGLAMYPSYPVA